MKIKISKHFRDYFFDSIKRGYQKSWKEIRSEIGLSKSSLERYKSGKSLIPEDFFLKLLNSLSDLGKKKILKNIEKFPNNFGQIKGGKKAYSINFKKLEEGRKKGGISNKIKKKKIFNFNNFNLSPEICEVIGAFIGDGFFNCYNNKLYQVEFAGDSRFDIDYYTKRIIPIIKEVFPEVNPRIYKIKLKNAIRIVFYSKKLFCFLRDFLGFIPGKKAYTIYIPKKILISKEFLYPTVRGIFDTDGGIYLDKRKKYKEPYPRVIFQTMSKNLYIQLINCLSKEFKLYFKYNLLRKIYSIEIYGHNQLKKWMSLIGFSNKRHLNKIASIA